MTSDRRRWAALVVLCTGMLMIVLDLTVVNVALSAIQRDLGFTEASLAWVVNAYMIAFGGLLLLAGRLGDLLGRRRIFLTGLAIFSAASLVCGLAQSETILMLSVRFTEPLVMRFGARPVLVIGLVFIGTGLVAFTRAPVDGDYLTHVLPVMVLLGVGAGLAFPALMTLAMSGVTGENAGLASGLVNTTAQVGAALGLAVLATLSAARTEARTAAGAAAKPALTDGYHLAFWVAAALIGVSIVIALVVLAPASRTDAAAPAAAEDELVGNVC